MRRAILGLILTGAAIQGPGARSSFLLLSFALALRLRWESRCWPQQGVFCVEAFVVV